MPRVVKNFEYIKSPVRVVPDLLKVITVLTYTFVRRFAIQRNDLNYDGSQKNSQGQFIKVINKPIICKFFKDFTNNRKRLTGWQLLNTDLSLTFSNTEITADTSTILLAFLWYFPKLIRQIFFLVLLVAYAL